jgi:hypothetical protein
MDAGRARVNTWWPAQVRRMVGDVSPFLDLLRKLLPDDQDRAIVLAYMAACVQHKGRKFQWWPVSYRGRGQRKVDPVGLRGRGHRQHYAHWPKAKDLLNKFNGWLANKVFVAVEELQSSDSHEQNDVVESLKTTITGARGIQVESKGVDQVSMQIVANGMATTNYKTAVRKTPDNARRLAVFYTAQQTYADLERDGMTGDYFPKLYAWLEADGFALVSELLHTYPIPDEYNPPTTLHRAPATSTTDEAIAESRGNIEQSIMEAAAEGVPGFMGGWVSSAALDRLLEGMNVAARISHDASASKSCTTLGYMLHPGFADGRVNNPVQPDGRKVQLYVVRHRPLRRNRGRRKSQGPTRRRRPWRRCAYERVLRNDGAFLLGTRAAGTMLVSAFGRVVLRRRLTQAPT